MAKVTKEMGVRIFGEDKKGNPLKRLNVEQWAALWSLYDEYKNQRPADVYDSSTKIQQAVGQVIIDKIEKNSNIWLSTGSIEEIADIFRQARKSTDWEKNDYDRGKSVFSGTRPT